MSILSSIKGVVSKVVSSVKNTVGNLLTSSPKSLTGGAVNGASGAALDFSNPYNQSLGSNISGSSASKNPYNITTGAGGAPMTSIYPGGYAPAQPQVSFPAGVSSGSGQNMTSSVPMTQLPVSLRSGSSVGGSSPSADYSNQSFSSNLFSSSSSPTPSSFSAGTSLSAGSIGETPALIGSAPSATNYNGSVIKDNIAVGANPTTGIFDKEGVTTGADGKAIPTKDGAQDTEKSMLDKMLASLKAPASEADLYAQARRESGIVEAQQARNNAQNAINAVTSKMNADLLQLRGTAGREGVTEAVYGGQQAEITREATISLLPLQAQLAAAQGNLELAEQNTDTLFKIYAKDAQNSVDHYNSQVKAVYELATTQQKRKLDELTWQKNYNADVIKQDASSQSQMALQMLKDGNTAGYKAITAVRPPVNMQSPTFAQDYQKYKTDLANAVARSSVPVASGAEEQLYKGLTPQTATAVRSAVSKFSTEPTVTNFSTVQDGYNFSKSLDTKTKNPADDQALIYSLAKALDPGSVVREGEYATAQKYSQSWISAYGKAVTQALAGTGFLSETARANIKKTIEQKYNSTKVSYDNQYNQTANQISTLTGRNDGDRFLKSYVAVAPTSSAPAPKDGDTHDYNGVTYVVRGGKWVPK
jgi:hypothetical protein